MPIAVVNQTAQNLINFKFYLNKVTMTIHLEFNYFYKIHKNISTHPDCIQLKWDAQVCTGTPNIIPKLDHCTRHFSCHLFRSHLMCSAEILRIGSTDHSTEYSVQLSAVRGPLRCPEMVRLL